MSKLSLRLHEVCIIMKYFICSVFAIVVRKHHWVITERGDDARDNGYWLYKYIVENHPEQKVYFVIDRESVDYPKVKEHAVQHGSLRSYWLIATAQKLISTHYASGIPLRSPKLFQLLGLHKKFYFLQHGVIKDNIETLYGIHSPMKLFICGAKPEYEYINTVYQHPAGVVQYTGLARFDVLHEFAVKQQILIMPTWRTYISNEQTFLKSDYFAMWQQFLSDDRLEQALEEFDIQLVFYPHYGMQPFIKHFSTRSNRIIIAKFEECDVQTLLKESAVLITDYSSVFFDFGYMQKPVLYYQFDEDDYFGKHYHRGYFDYRSMGFGDVCVEKDDLINALKHICEMGMKMEEKFLKRIDDFFPLHDQNNCKRIYDVIHGDMEE